MERNAANAEATELVYVPRGSWAPPMFAFGLAAIPVGILVWWPYGVAGAIVALVALWSMIRRSSADAARLPRHQNLTTAVLPPLPPEQPR